MANLCQSNHSNSKYSCSLTCRFFFFYIYCVRMCLANNDDLGYSILNCIATSCYIHVFLWLWSCKQNKATCVMNSYDSILPSHYCSIFSADRWRNTPAAISCDVVAPSTVWNYKIYQELYQPLSTILTNPGLVMTWPAFAFDGDMERADNSGHKGLLWPGVHLLAVGKHANLYAN